MKKSFKTLLMIFLLGTGFSANSQAIPKWKTQDLQSIIDTSAGPTIINFWATFCVPCIKELPHFQKLAQQYKNNGVQLYLVSLDVADAYPRKIDAFTKRLKITAPTIFLDETNADEFCPVVDKSWSGAIPATLFLNKKTGYRKFIEEELSEEALESEIKKMLHID